MRRCRNSRPIVLGCLLYAAICGAAILGCESKPLATSNNPPDFALPETSPAADAVEGDNSPRPKLQPGAKTKVLPPAGDRPYDKTFDDLRFEIQPGDPFDRDLLPESIEAMVGQRIRIRGFMLPTPQKRGIKQFVLVRDNQECCFGPGAALYDCILVEMQQDKTAEFSIRPIAVEGTFDVQEFLGLDGKHLAIYRIEGESAK